MDEMRKAQDSAAEQPADPQVVAALTGIPQATFDSVGRGGSDVSFAGIKPFSYSSSSPSSS